jgi:hypothetical protein
MNLLLKYLIYSVVLVVLLTSALKIFSYHPEAQLAFMFPGMFLFIISLILDDLLPFTSARLYLTKGR